MKHNSVPKAVSLRILFQCLLFSTLLFAILAYLYWQSRELGTPANITVYASMYAFLFFFGLLQWLVHKNTLAKLLVAPSKPAGTKSAPSPVVRSDEVGIENRDNAQKRLFVHLFSVLQREGRLMDFFQEDLSLFEDAQIGAAVRGIHESCQKTLARYLSPEPIMRQNEGSTVEIPAGFDRQAIKLTGNVVGDPPFSGVLRHRGWRLQSVALPTLSATDNPDLIAPAEVEIL